MTAAAILFLFYLLPQLPLEDMVLKNSFGRFLREDVPSSVSTSCWSGAVDPAC